jgi:hypothetical protein
MRNSIARSCLARIWLQLTFADLQPDHNRTAPPSRQAARGGLPREGVEMKQFSYRLVLTTVALAMSLAVWWAGAATARPYIDRPGTGGGALISPVSDVPASPAGGDAFDWLDAGVGAATTVGLALVAGGACVLVLRRRRNEAFS